VRIKGGRTKDVALFTLSLLVLLLPRLQLVFAAILLFSCLWLRVRIRVSKGEDKGE
jgi:uncharacterized membrane protein YciS (DUF1049 family)